MTFDYYWRIMGYEVLLCLFVFLIINGVEVWQLQTHSKWVSWSAACKPLLLNTQLYAPLVTSHAWDKSEEIRNSSVSTNDESYILTVVVSNCAGPDPSILWTGVMWVWATVTLKGHVNTAIIFHAQTTWRWRDAQKISSDSPMSGLTVPEKIHILSTYSLPVHPSSQVKQVMQPTSLP